MQKILIIEDEVSIRNVLVRILKDENKNFVAGNLSGVVNPTFYTEKKPNE